MLFLLSLIFFKIKIFKKFSLDYHKSVKQFGSRSDPTFTIRVSNSLDPDQTQHLVGPDLCPICLLSLSADDTSR